MSTNLLPFLSLLFLLLGACSGETAPGTDDADTVSIPELLPRPEALQQTMEWDQTQSGYMQMAGELRLENPDAIEPRITIAKIFVNEARVTGEHGHYYPAALQMLDEALALNHAGPKDPNLEFDALSTKAGVQLSQHAFPEALATAKQAISINPYNAQVYGAVVDANVELGNYAAAIAAADKMNEIRPDLRSYSRVSYLREIHGDVDGAIEAMKRAVNAGAPGYESTAWARLTLGELYHRYGQPDKAAEQYAIILRERPNYPFALAAQAELAMDNKEYEEAERLLNEARDIIPEVGYYTQLAEIYQLQGRTEESAAIEEEILAMLEDDVQSGHNMDMEYAAWYQDHHRDYDKALEYMKGAYEVRPDNIDVNRMLAEIYAHRGDLDKAREHLAKAAATDSKHPDLERIRSLTSASSK
ncbi:tetratricopeptide repeat protein [Lewinella sp. IMCC34183]|uniref:tetratricopeptide repeat protein n=1 Tax=Lewinella sp. IMCC34183 TaxID=2248762 RepID=UPI000E249AAD|nr:tetratricopeptide repeat protein [Lewinella sp. IMCC34183]